MTIAGDLLETLSKLSALEARTADVRSYVERVDSKIDNLLERLSRLEEKYDSLRSNVKNEILADIKADIVRVQADCNQNNNMLQLLSKNPKLAADIFGKDGGDIKPKID